MSRRAKTTRTATLVGLLAALGGATGCTHNYYYGAMPAGVVPGQPVTVQRYGEVCVVPPAADRQVAIQRDGQPSSVTGAAPSRVVVSQSQGSGAFNSRGSRMAWRRPDPETLATTRVEGAIDDDTKIR